MSKHNLILYLLILLLAAHLSSFILITNIIFFILFVFGLTDGGLKSKVTTMLSSKLFWVLLVPFIVYFFSLLYTHNTSIGLKELEKKISLFMVPIIFGLLKIGKEDVFKFLKAAVLLISFLPVIAFINQFIIYSSAGDTGYLYSDNLVSIYNKQAAYYSFFVNSALLMLFYLNDKRQLKQKIIALLGVLCFVLLISTQYLLASRTSMATTALIIGAYLIWLIIKKLNIKQGLLLFGGSISLIIIMLLFFPKVIKRFRSITNLEYRYDNPNPINHFNGEIKKENWNGLNTRLALWNCAWEEIQKSPIIGIGLGDVQIQLTKNYQEKNFILALKHNYNCHNQYLDIALSSGLIGLGLYLFFLTYLLFYSVKKRDLLMLTFLAIFMLSCLTENMLNRNQGVVFFVLLISLYSFRLSDKDKLPHTINEHKL